MITTNFNALNPLEQHIHATLVQHPDRVGSLRIAQAAVLCGCSASKISKFVKKLGFANFKRYLEFVSGKEVAAPPPPPELDRIKRFIDGFDNALVDDLAAVIHASDKLVLLGAGPSFLCAQYFEYKLKTCVNKIAIATPDDLSASSMIDPNTLLLIFTVTGSFRSFETLYHETRTKGGNVAMVIEEYNSGFLQTYDKIYCLTQDTQSNDLKPHEKSRTLFFIFMEEVIRKLSALQSTL